MPKKGIYFYEFAGKLVVLWECENVKEQGNFLRELRMRKGLKQKDVASALGFSIQLISAWEKGGSFPDAFSWKKILDLYGISLPSLLYEDLSLASAKTDMEFRPEEFAARLERLRKKKGLTQVELSAGLGINVKTLRSFEKGSSAPSRKTFLSLCEVFALSPDELYFGIEPTGHEDVKKTAPALLLWKKAVPPIGLSLFALLLCINVFEPAPSAPARTESSASSPISLVSETPSAPSISLPQEAYSLQTLPAPDSFRLIVLDQQRNIQNILSVPYGAYPKETETCRPYDDHERGVSYLFQGYEGMDTRCYEDRILIPKFKEIPLIHPVDEQYRYRFLPNGEELELLECYEEPHKDHYLPSAIHGYPVTSLNFAFVNDHTIENLFIPDSVKTIKMPLMLDCDGLRHIELSANLEYVEFYITINADNLEYNQYSENMRGRYLGSKDNSYFYCDYSCGENEDILLHPDTRIIDGPPGNRDRENFYVPKNAVMFTETMMDNLQRSRHIFVDEGNPYFQKVGGCLIDVRDSALLSMDEGTDTLPEGIRIIKDGALRNFTGTILELPLSVTDIERQRFYVNDVTKTVKVGPNVAFISHDAFSSFQGLVCFDVDESNLYYQSYGGNLYSKGLERLFCHPAQSEVVDFSLSHYVNCFGRRSFDHCANLRRLELVKTDASVASALGEESVIDCPALKEITIDLDAIHSHAIMNCPSLESITFGKELKSINTEVIENCPSLRRIYYKGSEKEWNMIYRQGAAFPDVDIEYIFLG